MNIAILTYPLTNNYGCLLQAYALQTYLIKMGHKVTIINKRDPRSDFSVYWVFRLFKSLYCKLLNKTYLSPREIIVNRKSNLDYISKNLKKFQSQYLHLSPVKYQLKSGDKDINNFDIYIVGSDQVWRYNFLYRYIKNYFFDFVPKEKIMFSYAASFGVDELEYPEELLKECSILLNKFNSISVREIGGIKICKEYFKVDAKQVIDPTILLSKEEYIYSLRLNIQPNNNLITTYILDSDDDKDNFINNCLIRTGYKKENLMPVRLASNVEINTCVFISVNSWLEKIANSTLVITDSFHGCVFSILFNKPFWALGNKERGNARIYSLLSMFGLENRFVKKDFSDINIEEKINWNDINLKVNKYRDEANSFLLKNIQCHDNI